QIEKRSDAELPVTFRGNETKAKVRMASGFLGDVRVDWIQPMDGANAFTEFQKKHRSGIFSLVHRVGSQEALEKEKERLQGLGVSMLQAGDHVTYFDTEPEGKYVLGLYDGPESPAASVG